MTLLSDRVSAAARLAGVGQRSHAPSRDLHADGRVDLGASAAIPSQGFARQRQKDYSSGCHKDERKLRHGALADG